MKMNLSVENIGKPKEIKYTIIIVGAGGGEIEGSCFGLEITDIETGEKQLIQIDAGANSKPLHREEKQRLHDLVKQFAGAVVRIMTHPHNDHIGNLIFYLQEKMTKVLIPRGSLMATRVSLENRMQFLPCIKPGMDISIWEQGMLTQIDYLENLFNQGDRLIQQIETERNRRRKTKNNIESRKMIESVGREIEIIEDEIEACYKRIHEDSHIRQMLVGKHYLHPDEYRKMIREKVGREKDIISTQGLVSPELKLQMFHSLEEVPLYKPIEISRIGNKPVMMSMANTGHLQSLPAVSVRITIGEESIFFGGDRGRNDVSPPYTAPALEPPNSVDTGIFECTYGDRIHSPRDIAMRKFISDVKRAIRRGDDILIPTISLDRPLVVLYELVMGLENDVTLRDKFNLFWFGPLIEKYLNAVDNEHPMKKKIMEVIEKRKGENLGTKYNEMRCRSFGIGDVDSLGKKSPKSRIIVCGGGFIPENGSPFGQLYKAIANRKSFRIFLPNYFGGPESNGHMLYARKEFRIGDETFQLHGEQRATRAKGFSGHADAQEMEELICRVMKPGGTVVLVHGSNKARRAFKERLERNTIVKEKSLKIILPDNGETIIFDPNEHTPHNDSPDLP